MTIYLTVPCLQAFSGLGIPYYGLTTALGVRVRVRKKVRVRVRVRKKVRVG
jgi:hypothetical protein